MIAPRWCWFLVSIIFGACSSQRYLNNQLREAENTFKDHIGFVLYDPGQHKTLFDHQGDRYFIPASNIKIFTLYTSLRLLGDSIPALRYFQRNDSLIFWGTGDPGFLYGNLYAERKVFEFLKNNQARLFFSSSNFFEEQFGPGWAWDDYAYAYQAERTPFPVYGNQVAIRISGDTIRTSPALFKNFLSVSPLKKNSPDVVREIETNTFTYFPGVHGKARDWNIPFCFSDELLGRLLSDTLKREVQTISTPFRNDSKIIYATPADSLYKRMMQQSDNFIAEQLLLLCANTLSDTLRSSIAIDYAKKNFFSDLRDEPVWIDGSGLSRYNLLTPRSIVSVWEKIYDLVPRQRLFSLLAVGGQNGTLKNQFKAEEPFIFGKTGTLNNNHSLSGYLVTRKGRTLIFSWMNNNFTKPTREVRLSMEVVLRSIYEKY